MKDTSVQWLTIIDRDLEVARAKSTRHRNGMIAAASIAFTTFGSLLTLIGNHKIGSQDLFQVNLFFSAIIWTFTTFMLIANLYGLSDGSRLISRKNQVQELNKPRTPDMMVLGLATVLFELSYLISLTYVWNLNLVGTLVPVYLGGLGLMTVMSIGLAVGFNIRYYHKKAIEPKKPVESSVDKVENTIEHLRRMVSPEANEKIDRMVLAVARMDKQTKRNAVKVARSRDVASALLYLCVGIFLLTYTWLLFPREDYLIAASTVYLIVILVLYIFSAFGGWVDANARKTELTDLRNTIVTNDPEERGIVTVYKNIIQPPLPTGEEIE